MPVDLDEDRQRIDIEAANLAERSIGPAMDVESVAARRFQFDLGTRARWPLSYLQTAILAPWASRYGQMINYLAI